MLRVGIALLALALPMAGAPALDDLLGTAIDFSASDWRISAPIILAGLVESNEPVEAPHEARLYRGVFVQRRVVRISIDRVLRGDLGDAKGTSFSYYAEVPTRESVRNPVHKHLYEAIPGRRYLFFLMGEVGSLRSIGDVGPYSIPVLSGTHRGSYAAPGPTEVGRRIADVLLVLNADAELNEFCRRLPETRVIADFAAGRRYTFGLLKDLLVHGGKVEAAACVELARFYYGQRSCLEHLMEDTNQPVGVRRYASELAASELRALERLRDQLHDPARLSFPRMVNPDSAAANLEELKLILEEPDPVVRSRVCVALARYFPYADLDERSAAVCGGVRGKGPSR